MAATIATTMAILNPKSLNNPPKLPTLKPIISMQNLSKGLKISPSQAGTALAGAFFASLTSTNPAFAAQQLAEIAESSGASGDNRGLALLLPLIPAIAWVLYNILQPALNQINRMRSDKGIIIGLGLSGLAASGFVHNTPHASAADEIAMLAAAAAADATSDNRGQLLLIVVTPAILWVLYNILQPALNQINKMRSQ